MRARRSGAPTGAELHRRWLELVDTDGPFLAVPPLKRVWPQGIPPINPTARAVLVEAKPDFEKAWEAWDRGPKDDAGIATYRTARDTWVDTVMRDVIGWGNLLILPAAESLESAEGPDAQLTTITATSPNRSVAIHPSGMLRYNDQTAALVLIVDPCDSLRDVVDDGWAASPIDRMEALLRSAEVPIGVVTDGRWWGLVCVRQDAMVASGIVDSQTWIEDPDVRDAFITILQRRSLIGGNPEDRLPKLFEDSVAAAEEITEALGVQVRRAVELLINAFSEAAVVARDRGEEDPLPFDREQVYQASVTMLMRIVFLLFAEERSLLPQGELFTLGYGISGELDDLEARDRDEGAESLDSTYLSWHRLLATSRALYAGATFEDIRLPAYGGSLFDPDRFAFLTARQESGTLRIAVTDRVMLEIFRAVQVAELRGQPARRISFRDVDVEQIGYIYEGLLGYSCIDVTNITLGLIGTPGAEPEIVLYELERLARQASSEPRLAEQIIASVKESQPGAKPPTRAALAKALKGAADVEEAERALLAVTHDSSLRRRLRPFMGAIRRDLRGRPMVIRPGGLLVIETPSRVTSGAHYTPRFLAEEIVEHALEPLVYRPGPHQTADRDKWMLISSDDILDLKVADIACGSGAFLVAAARYLAARLVEAWLEEGATRGAGREQEMRAIRQVVASCLYGADINPMAVEMCKLSLWLVSLDPRLPFSFVDDKLLVGNSLLGVTDARQLRALHIYPEQETLQGSLLDLDVDQVLNRASRIRQRLASEIDNEEPQRSAAAKRRQLNEYRDEVASLTKIADGVVAAGLALGGKPGRELDHAYENLRIAVGMAFPHDGEPDPTILDAIIERGLTPTVETDYERWQPLHWVLAVPDVVARGGFDAVVGNPPFLGGQKLTGAMGTNLRNWFVSVLADGQRGSADLVAYFFLRGWGLLNSRGTIGLMATNTVAQGDTREVGLDRLVLQGMTITRSVQSQSWPAASANLEYAAVWGTGEIVSPEAERISDGIVVPRISTLLEPVGRIDGHPVRLPENTNVAFVGCTLRGMGFVLEPGVAEQWIENDARTKEVLFPFMNGEDLTSRPDTSASRCVIDFYPRSQNEARAYRVPFERTYETVRVERASKANPVRQAPWWLFWRTSGNLRKATEDLDEVLAITIHSRAVMPVRVMARQVFSHAVVVVATESYADQAVLSSSLHQMWAIRYGSSLETRVRYTASDVFETFPRPHLATSLDRVGETLDMERREIMLRRQLGLTKLYNLINDPDISDASDPDVAHMRQIHVDLDHAVMAAYGWDDVPLDHGFHSYRQMTRWTVSPPSRVEIFDRLMEENHRRAAIQGAADDADDDEEVGE